MEPDDRFEELVLRWQELRDDGHRVSPRELCGDFPELEGTLQSRVKAVEYWEGFLGMDTEATRSAQEPAPAPSPPFGKYRVVRRLGGGGQATTLLAFDPDLQRHVVLKVYHEARTPQQRDVVLREGRALARVRSPYVAQCLAAERLDGVPFLVVEYVAGANLGERHRERPLTPTQAAELICQLAEGLAAVHACGLLHRDLKPANVLLDGSGRPRLIDFGLAVPFASEALAQRSGTVAYMAPEQARGEVERIDPRTDVFGLGAILYELLTGRPPHEGKTRDELWKAACRGDVRRPQQLNPKVPAALDRICMKALATDPAGRYASATELADGLRRYLGRRRRLTLAAGTVAALLLVGIGVWLIGANRQSPASEPARPPLGLQLNIRSIKQGTDGLRPLDEPGVLPLLVGDALRIEAYTARKAYFYVLNLTADGKVSLMFPWRNDEDWDSIADERPRAFYCVPDPGKGDAAKLDPGPSGIESVVVLVRETPLTADERGQLRELLKSWPVDQGKFDPLRAAVAIGEDEFCFGNLSDQQVRGKVKSGDAIESNDPVLRLRRLLQSDVRSLGVASRGVCYTFKGE